MRFFALTCLLLSPCLVVVPAKAQTNDPYGYESSTPGENPADPGSLRTTLIRDPGSVAPRLAAIRGECKGAGPYVLDCLAERLEALDKDMARLPGHGQVRRTLRDTAAQLHDIARENADPSKPRARILGRGGAPRSERTLVAVAPQRRRQAAQQALQVLAEAETVLLRAAETSGNRSVQFQDIAAALGSNKVLLRSA